MRGKAMLVALMTVLSLSSSACIGRMAVTREVSRFNLSAAESRGWREVVFFALHVVPVYPLAQLTDHLIVNSIEFWSGENPVSGETRLAEAGDSRVVRASNGEYAVSTLREDGSLDVELYASDGSAHFVNLSREDDRIVARDASGAVLGETDASGRQTLSDASSAATR